MKREDLFDTTDHSLTALIERHVDAKSASSDPAAADELARARDLLARLKSRRLLKRACVFPLYANRDVQAELLDRFFAPGKHVDRRAFEQEVADGLRRAGSSRRRSSSTAPRAGCS
jgi:hypothetical protein